MVVTVTNFNYSAELQDTRSETYRSFEKHFQQEVGAGDRAVPPWPPCPLAGGSPNPLPSQIKKIYGNIPGYEGVRIISLK